MKSWYLGLLLFAVVGCGHKLSETDIVGNWTHDPAGPDPRGSQATLKLAFTADHKYAVTNFAATSPIEEMDGNWSYDVVAKKTSLTPLSVTIKAAGTKMTMTFAELIQKAQTMGATAEQVNQIQMEQRTRYYEPSDDGKKLSEGGRPAFIKSES